MARQMILTLVFLVLFGFTSADWELYKNVYGKNYNPTEELFRKAVFMENVAKINAHNLRYDLGLTTYRMGLTQLTDFTSEEFNALKGLRFNATETILTGELYKPGVSYGTLPDAVDWRESGFVTPVKDQGQCLSCWAFSATGALEGQHFRATGELVSLSEQNLVDCSGPEGNMGCRGGWVTKAFTHIKEHGGINTEESYPYSARDDQCQFKSDSVGARVTGFVDLPRGDERSLQEAVATVGPISVTIDASKESFHHYKGGVYDEPDCSSVVLDHSVLAVGYGSEDGVDYWLVKNSWNTIWGVEGYIKMSRNKNNQCGIATQSTYPTV